MKYLLEHLKHYKKESILAPLFKMLEALFDLFVPIVVADIINVGIGNQDNKYIMQRCGILVLLALIGIACSFTAQFFAARASVGCAAGLRHSLFAHIQKLGYSEIDTIGTSTLITRMTSDINQVQNGINMVLRLFLRSPFIVFGAMIMAFTINVKIALVFLAAIPVLSVIVFGIMKITSPLYKRIQGRLDCVLGITRENLTGVRVIRAFGKEDSEVERFENDNNQLTSMQLHVGHISALMNPLTYVVVNLATIAILKMGAVRIDSGVLMSGDVVALVNYMSQILVELVKLANLIVLLSKALASLHRVQDVLDTEPSMKFVETENREQTDKKKDYEDEAVAFENVSLTYAGAGEESLTNISFHAKKGQTIGVIGGTGSGKSSLVNLIPRFYDATSGQVRVMGIPVKEWDREELRKSVSVVMQKAQLFTGTIRSNLLWGNQEATDEELWKALELAQAAEFVHAKPQGLDEVVEQGGRNFSGGQKQRLTIARALVKQPDILILDDSASALDFATDAALRKALATLPGDITVFIVSQRTSSLKHADRILVLDDGQIADQGTHEELLEKCDVYREIYESQFKKGEMH
ncbi:ABC transporter ATP-binding protein/permease [bacterium]|nr:ABC transporter ATP-binding protein/permease [bacterium]MDY3023236.1 ABC transporter ATP-binding protein [Oliverpabstia sp.]